MMNNRQQIIAHNILNCVLSALVIAVLIIGTVKNSKVPSKSHLGQGWINPTPCDSLRYLKSNENIIKPDDPLQQTYDTIHINGRHGLHPHHYYRIGKYDSTNSLGTWVVTDTLLIIEHWP